MKTLSKILLPTLAALLMSACATMSVTTDYDHAKDFGTLKTYAIYNAGQNRSVTALNAERVVNSVRSALNAKGYTEVQSNPDMLVNINTIIKNKQAVTADTNTDFYGGYGNFYGYGGFYRPYGYWGGGFGPGMVNSNSTTTFNVQDYKEGSLIIDMIDPATNKLFWESVGNSQIDGTTIENPDQRIPAAINKILAPFPAAGSQPKK